MQIVTGQKLTAQKTMVYGLSGVGKSSLASKIGKPLFLDFEGGLEQLGVPRVKVPTYDAFVTAVTELINESAKKAKGGKSEYEGYNTLVIDSIDWCVRRIVEKAAGIDANHLLETLNKSNGGYGSGKQVLANYVRSQLLPQLSILNRLGWSIVLVAHADRKSVMSQEGYDITQVTPKIDAETMNVLVEWVDNVFYLKNTNGNRTIQVEGTDDILAKNRLGLTGSYDINETDINQLLTGKTKSTKETKEK